MTLSKYKLFQKYLQDLLQHQGRDIGLSVMITVFSGLTKGGSFIMLLPLFKLVGISDEATVHSRALDMANYIWKAIGIPLTLYACLTSYLVLILIYALLNYFKTLLDTRVVQAYKQTLRNDLFSAVIDAEWTYIKNAESPHIFNNLITEINNIGYATALLVSSFSTVVILVFYTVTSVYVSFKMTLIASVCFLPLLVIQRRLNKRAYLIGEASYNRHESLFKAVLEFVNSFKLAKSYNLQDQYVSEFRQITRQTADDENRYARIIANTAMLYEVGSAVMICIVLIWAITVAKIPAVDLVLLVYIASKLLPNFSSLIRNFNYLLNMLPSYEGVYTLLNKAKQHKEPISSQLPILGSPEQAIVFSEVEFGYEVGTPIFRKFNCEIKIGQITSIKGVSGKGKTTLMDLLLGLLTPQKGSIKIDGTDLRAINLAAWRNTIAYIPQECFLFNATIRQNLLWAKPDASDDELRTILTLVAGDFVFALQSGLDTVVGDQGIRLSGGERQRIAFARAMLRSPKLLILDEATNALDPFNESIIQMTIQRLKSIVTILIISHSANFHDGADQVIVVE